MYIFMYIFPQFNEPGGLCASEDGSSLYIADTNNHAIKVLSLKDNLVKQVGIWQNVIIILVFSQEAVRLR